MEGFVRVAKHPYYSLTHHGLIKILILRALVQINQTWDKFTIQPQLVQGPIPFPKIPIREVRAPIPFPEIPIREVRAPIPFPEIPIREVKAPTLMLNVQLEEEQED